MQELEQNWQEPLHEYSQFASIIKKLLVYRHQKHVQLEMTQDALEARREQLMEYEKSEREAQRLEEALGRGRVTSTSHSTSPSSFSEPGSPFSALDNPENSEAENAEGEQDSEAENPTSAYVPPHPGPNPSRRRVPGMGLLNALSYTLHGMMDSDPESARRNGISKTRENISQVCQNTFAYF
jgi:sorting nexin-41/42